LAQAASRGRGMWSGTRTQAQAGKPRQARKSMLAQRGRQAPAGRHWQPGPRGRHRPAGKGSQACQAGTGRQAQAVKNKQKGRQA